MSLSNRLPMPRRGLVSVAGMALAAVTVAAAVARAKERGPLPDPSSGPKVGAPAPTFSVVDVLEAHDGGAVDARDLAVGEVRLQFPERFRRRLARQVRSQAQRGAVALRLEGPCSLDRA